MTSVRPLVRALAAYVEVLESGVDGAAPAEDRPKYVAHLAAAARMFRALEDGSMARLKAIVTDERCVFGKSSLAGDPGLSAEVAFDAFARQVDGS